MLANKFLELFNQKPAPHFIISTHKFCDGDGLGAGLAFCYALKKIGHKCTFFTLEQIQSKYLFMDTQNIIQVFDEKKSEIPKNSVFVFVDVNDTRLIEPLYSSAKKAKAPVYFIDHHPLIQKTLDDHFFIDTTSSSTGEIIYKLIKELNIPLDENICTSVFSSIVFDTNRFRDVKNSPRPFSIAAEIIPKIKDVNLVYENLFKTLRAEELRFMSQLENVEYYSNNRVAFLHLKNSDFEKYKTENTQAYELMEIVRDVKTIDSTILIIEQNDGSFKLSLRSRKKDLLPLVEQFDGGGHKSSAGAYIKSKKISDVKKVVLSYLSD